MGIPRSFKLASTSFMVMGLRFQAANAQFGLPNNRRAAEGGAAPTFEQLNRMAADRMASEKNKKKTSTGLGGGLEAMLGDLGDYDVGSFMKDMDLGALMKDIDPETLQELVMEGLQNPQVKEMFAGMKGAMDELLKMDSNQLKAQMEEAMDLLTSTGMQKNILSQKDDVLAMMEAQGTVSPEEIAGYREDPTKFEEAMTEAFGKMKEIFSDPKNLETVVEMMKGFGAIMQDPVAAMSKLGGVLQDALADDEKIEEARLQLLSDPTVAGNKVVSDMFGSEEMQEILKDPMKWRKSVKEGQKLLLGSDAEKKVIGMGEL